MRIRTALLASASALAVAAGLTLSGPASAAVTTSYTDTSLLVVQPTNNAFVHEFSLGCTEKTDGTNTFETGGAAAEGHSLTWSLSAVTGAPSLKVTSTGAQTAQITDGVTADAATAQDVTLTASDGYGDITNAVVDLAVAAGVVTTSELDSGNCIAVDRFPSEQSGGVQFDAVDSSFSNGEEALADEPAETAIADTVPAVEGFTWSASGLPSGVSIDPAKGFIAPGTAAPGQYGVVVTATDASGAASTITFTLQVNATATTVVTPGNLGDEVNAFGNGFDVFQQHWAVNAIITGWTATKGDPATHFIQVPVGSGFEFEAVNGKFIATGLCVSDPGGGYAQDPGGPDGLVLRGCNLDSLYQQFDRESNGNLVNVRTGLIVNPHGTGKQLTDASTAAPWAGGSVYQWQDISQLA